MPKRRKRKQKQNKRKAKKAKQKRIEANCEVVIKTIAPQHNVDSDAEPAPSKETVALYPICI